MAQARDSMESFDSADLERRDDLEDLNSSTEPKIGESPTLARGHLDEMDQEHLHDSLDSNSSTKHLTHTGTKDSPPLKGTENETGEYEDEEIDIRQALVTEKTASSTMPRYGSQEPREEEASSDDEEKDASQGQAARGNSTSQNVDYSSLDVSAELKKLFDYIDSYKSQDLELETRLKPFIPEYIPAVGDIDAFLKIPRPDSKPDQLGLVVLDEPSAKQTDPTVYDMQLKWMNKNKTPQPTKVRGIDNADKNTKSILSWVNRIGDLHRTKPAPTVTYSKPMPDVSSLMQEWPQEFEQLLESAKLPGADLDVTLKQYAKVVCALLDIPVYSNHVESLHVLFSLYSAFKENQHFSSAQPNDLFLNLAKKSTSSLSSSSANLFKEPPNNTNSSSENPF